MSNDSDVQPQEGKQVYCTLVMTDSYVVGAVVLAHSLRDAGTKKELAVIVTPDTMSEDAISCLRDVYDHVIPVDRVSSSSVGNLALLGRPDLRHTFTKIEVFRLTQFSKIVYIDADVVALRAPDELFDLPVSFAAVPDVGWPDAFNSGVFLLSPDQGRYEELAKMAANSQSFDGADQGLLNEYFEKQGWHRLSFVYNCTPNAEYGWAPAYHHYKDGITLVHFIGKQKPWSRGTYGSQQGSGVYRELLSKWWQVKNRHPGREIRRAGDKALPLSEWDATRSAPPTGSLAEGANFPGSIHYQFAGPNQGYNAHGYQMEPLPPPLFPWEKEGRSHAPTRVWHNTIPPAPVPQPEPEAEAEVELEYETAPAAATVSVDTLGQSESGKTELNSPDEPKLRAPGLDYRGRPRFRPAGSASPTPKSKKGINRTQTPFVHGQDDDEEAEWQPSEPAHENSSEFRPMVNAWDADPVVQRYMRVMMSRHAAYSNNNSSTTLSGEVDEPTSARGFLPSYPSFKHASQFSRDSVSVTSDAPSLTGNRSDTDAPESDARGTQSDSMAEAITEHSTSSAGEEDGLDRRADLELADMPLQKLADRMRRKRAVRKDVLTTVDGVFLDAEDELLA